MRFLSLKALKKLTKTSIVSMSPEFHFDEYKNNLVKCQVEKEHFPESRQFEVSRTIFQINFSQKCQKNIYN